MTKQIIKIEKKKIHANNLENSFLHHLVFYASTYPWVPDVQALDFCEWLQLIKTYRMQQRYNIKSSFEKLTQTKLIALLTIFFYILKVLNTFFVILLKSYKLKFT